MRSIRVTLERSWTKRRFWLKAVDSNGTVVIVANIPASDATYERNKLLDKLVASGVYDEVTGDAIKAFPDKANPWTIKRKNNEDPNSTSKRYERKRTLGRLHQRDGQTPRGDSGGQ